MMRSRETSALRAKTSDAKRPGTNFREMEIINNTTRGAVYLL